MNSKRRTTQGPCSQKKSRKKLSKDEVATGIELEEYQGEERPLTWGECKRSAIRPCPFVRCRYNLYLSVKKTTIRVNFPTFEGPHEMIHSCALEEAETYDGMTLEEVSHRLNITRERVRQIEATALQKLRWLRYALHDPHLQDLLGIWETLEEVHSRRPSWDDDWIFME